MLTAKYVYMPLNKDNALFLKPLLACLEDIEVWMAIHFLNFNEKKTEVMVFGPKDSRDLGSLALYMKPIISNLGFKINTNFKLN